VKNGIILKKKNTIKITYMHVESIIDPRFSFVCYSFTVIANPGKERRV